MNSFSFKRFLLLAMPTFLISCAIMNRKDFAQEQYEKNRQAIAISYSEQMFAPSCELRKNELSLHEQCPPLLSVESDAKIEPLMKKYLQEKNKNKTKIIFSQIQDIVSETSAKMTLRYKYADTAHVQLECQAQPHFCDKSTNYELLLLLSHDEKLQSMALQAVSNYDLSYADSVIARRRHRELVNSINNSRHISCTGTKSGNITNVDCN